MYTIQTRWSTQNGGYALEVYRYNVLREHRDRIDQQMLSGYYVRQALVSKPEDM